ncbi:phosphodiester glycosidase family protein [Streptomyces sp. CT34]|uniref:phosphodiester glycosidase family protein n=1 Tax=Streptomyces sp. CT34 TaxID=1553907 RepID=UPI0005BAD54A|nr:phosphodiester glycosidase family protein [Streptomyces sp. CT34]
MKQRFGRVRATATVLVAWGVLVGGGLADGGRAAAAGHGIERTDAVRVAPGVTYAEFRMRLPRGIVHGHLLTVDLSDRDVSVDLLHPRAVAERAPVSELADDEDVVGAVNGDFFDISETRHPGVAVTGAAVGPAVASGRELKGAVPNGQRFGPVLPPGATTEDVLTVGRDHRARLDRLALRGTVRSAGGSWRLRGLNQYALPVGGIGAYTPAWGPVSRERAVCGTDTNRSAGCTKDTAEVTVRRGRVATVGRRPGKGEIASGSVVLLGREAGARLLRTLRVGERVRIGHRLVGQRPGRPRFAVGGFPIVRNARPAGGLNTVAVTMRTSVGIADRGRKLYLMATDGEKGRHQTGLTVRELAELMVRLGAREAMDLDGGGSSTFVSRDPDDRELRVRNHPTTSTGRERPVANAIGVFSTG